MRRERMILLHTGDKSLKPIHSRLNNLRNEYLSFKRDEYNLQKEKKL